MDGFSPNFSIPCSVGQKPRAWHRTVFLVLCLSVLLVRAASAAEPGPGERVRWLADNAVAVRSIAPADEDFSDLMPLVKWIGDSRVVALGEVTHGDGPTFQAKARLLRFLHQVMGFDVLAWESGFFDVPLMDAALRSDVPLPEAARQGLYRIWWSSQEVQPVLAYLRSTQATTRPIQSVGFDCRVSTNRSRSELFPASIFQFFDRLDPALISKRERASLTAMSIGLVPAEYFEKPGERIYDRDLPRRLISVIDERRKELLVRASPREIDHIRQSLVSLLAMDRALGGQAGTGQSTDGYNRDTAMAENLLWLLENPLAGRKVIVWAHNFHVQRDIAHPAAAAAMAKAGRSLAGPTGLHLARALGSDLYVIGFLAHHGRYGYAGEEPVEITPAEPDSLEGLLHAVGKPHLLLDLRGLPGDHWLRSPLTTGLYFYEPQETDVPRLYDAVFFLDEMKPSTAVAGAAP
jgi:erythromycin esterase